jgi:hypothetical protein
MRTKRGSNIGIAAAASRGCIRVCRVVSPLAGTVTLKFGDIVLLSEPRGCDAEEASNRMSRSGGPLRAAAPSRSVHWSATPGNSKIGTMEAQRERAKTISDLIDRIEQIRDELLEIQRALEEKEEPSDRIAHEKSSK